MWALCATVAAGEAAPAGHVAALVQALAALALVCLIAWALLRVLSGRSFFRSFARSRHIEILERVPLDARRSVFLVRVGTRRFLLGSGDRGAPRVLSEIPWQDIEPDDEASRKVDTASAD